MKHVYWVVEGEIAGRAGPSIVPWTLQELADGGFGGLVSLCGNVSRSAVKAAGIMHLQVDEQLSRAKLVHCHHGLDRTGVVIACTLIALHGISAVDSIARVRGANPDPLRLGGHRDAVSNFESLHLESQTDVSSRRQR